MDLERLKQDLDELKERREAALFDISNLSVALLNYHRCDAVVHYIEGLLKDTPEGAEPEKENQDGDVC